MKKGIALILAIMMMLGCAAGLAEEADKKEEMSVFLQVKENVTAEIFTEKEDAAAAASLAAGRFCALIEEPDGKDEWVHVLYLGEKKEGKAGFLKAADVRRLSEAELEALKEDPEKLNEITDLLIALLNYSAGKDEGQQGGGMGSIVNSAAALLKKYFGVDAYAAADTVKGKADDVMGYLESPDGQGQVAGLLDSISGTAGNIQAGTGEEELNSRMNELTGALDNMTERLADPDIMDRAEKFAEEHTDIVDSIKDTLSKDGVQKIIDGVSSLLPDVSK